MNEAPAEGFGSESRTKTRSGRTHYGALGIGPTADESEIKQAYRRRAQETHPDKPGGDQDEFHAVALAYQVLSDPDRRSRYDRTGEDSTARTIESEIDGAVATLFMKIITAESPPANIVLAAKREVAGNQDRFRQQQKAAERKIAKLQKLLGRVVTKAAGGHNLFQGVLEEQIKGVERDLAAAQHALMVLAGVDTLLDSYADTAPAPERPADQMSSMAAMMGAFGTRGFSGFDPGAI